MKTFTIAIEGKKPAKFIRVWFYTRHKETGKITQAYADVSHIVRENKRSIRFRFQDGECFTIKRDNIIGIEHIDETIEREV